MIGNDARTPGCTDAPRRWATAGRRCVAASVVVLSGCAYFNGMYNANKFTRDAQRSERAGRPAEARERWQRAAIHAESVATRHPRSRWADDARLVQGRALLHLESWSEAVVALRQAALQAGDDEQRREALLLLGEAATAAHSLEEASAALDSAAGSARPERRSRALLARGRLRLERHDAAGALDDFAASGEREAPFWSARAALRLGDAERAAAELARPLSRGRVSPRDEATWLGLLDSLAQAGEDGPRLAGALVDQVVARGGLPPGAVARVLLADGGRLAGRGDTALAGHRFRAAAATAPDSAEARVAAVRLVLLDLQSVTDDSAVAAARRTLQEIMREGGPAAREAEQPARRLVRLQDLAADSGAAADARWFARAELARDSLAMRAWSAAAFAAMAERFPRSPWTPKALIAAIAQGSADSASLAATLAASYGDSPYVVAARGGDAPRYAALEDSLRTLLEAAGPGQARPDRQPGEDDEPGPRARPGVRPRPAQPRPAPGQPQPRDPQP